MTRNEATYALDSQAEMRTWSDALPSQQGWYWWRANPDIDEPALWEALYVTAFGEIPERGSRVSEYRLVHARGQWAGPLILPR